MTAFSLDRCHEWFANAQNRFTNCFIRQIVSESAALFQVRYVLWFRFQLLELLQHGSQHVVVEGFRSAVFGGQLSLSMKSGQCLPSRCFCCSVQLQNLFLKVAFPLIWCTSSIYSIKQQN